MDGIPHGVSCAIFAATCAFAAVLSSPAARAADPLMALILGRQGQSVRRRSPAARSMPGRSSGCTSTFLRRSIVTGESQADGRSVEKKADRYECKSDCSLSY